MKRTSRAFYLSLRFLPRSTRAPIALAYALARTADTIADHAALPAGTRARELEAFLASLSRPGSKAALPAEVVQAVPSPDERELLSHLGEHIDLLWTLAAEDRERVTHLLGTIVQGMLLDLSWFGLATSETPVALPSRVDLDRYCYHVAGAVGEFWTRMQEAHIPRFAKRPVPDLLPAAVRFGKGLQLTNVLRDLPRDLALGRSYLPAEDLARLGLVPADLLDPGALPRVRPLVVELVQVAIEHCLAGMAYTLALSRRQLRLRFSCALPLLMAVETLGLVAASPDLLRREVFLKITRRRVLALARDSLVAAPSDGALAAVFRRILRRAGFAEAARGPFNVTPLGSARSN
ncbi:MAG: squalene/phytoene synthase family protein [Planctomycetes bacterium]|nr:squalene/phytoene synthase family protein [Planctomycetota bacterium]